MDAIPANEVQLDPQPASASPPTQPMQSDVIPDNAVELDSDKYGSLGQQALTGLEGAARGATFGLSDVVEPHIFPTTKEDIASRKNVNPVTSLIGTGLGAAGVIAATGGLGLGAEEAAALKAAGTPLTLAARGAEALGGGLAGNAAAYGAEGALFGAGNAVSDYALDNGNLDAQKILSDVGMGAALGLGAGALGYGLKSLIGKSGAIKGTVSDILDNEASSANSEARTTEAIAKEANLKLNTPEIIQAGQDIGAPFIPETVSTDPWVQRFGDSLREGAPSIAGIERTSLYNQGWEAARKTASDILPSERLSKNQLGSSLRSSFTSKIAEQAEQFKRLYGAITSRTNYIPTNNGTNSEYVAKNILNLADSGTTRALSKFADTLSNKISSANTVQDLRNAVSVMRPMIDDIMNPVDKSLANKMLARTSDLSKRSMLNYAENLVSKYDPTNLEDVAIWGDKIDEIKNLVPEIKSTDSQYADFRQNKLNPLLEKLGKSRVFGPQDAINHIEQNLEPEDIASKLINTKNASLGKFLDEKFPEESALVKDYMKTKIREGASPGGQLDPKKAAENVFKLEPEIREYLFAPDELQKIKSIKTYLDSFPRNYNPSGTAGASAMRHFLESPAAATIGNVRDFAMKKYIDAMVSIPEELRPDPTIAGHEMAQKFNQLNAAAKIVEKTNKRINEGISSVLGLGGSIAGPALVGGHSFEQKSDRLKELSDYNTLGAQIQNHIQGTSAVLPNISQGIATSIASSVNYLNSVMPKSEKPLPLSPRIKISDAQKQHFNRTFDIVNDPVSILKHIKEGTLTTNDVKALQATHPDLYKDLQNKFIERGVSDRMVKLPYKTKQALSLFMGMPLDAGQVPAVKLANQSVFNMNVPQQQASQMPRRQRSTLGGLKQLDISGQYKTRTSREKTEEDL